MDDDRLHFYDDDGAEVAPDLIAKPGLCVTCGKDEDPSEVVPCTLIRLDQQDEDEFRCDAYVCKGS